MKLYELTGSYTELQNQIEDGEDSMAILDTLESIEGAIEEKAESIYRILQNLQADINATKAEEERLRKNRRYLENKIEWLKGYLSTQLEFSGISKLSTAIGTIGFRNAPPSVEILDEEMFINNDTYRDFIKTEYKINKRDLLKFAKEADIKEGPGYRIIDDKKTLQFR